MRHELPGLIGNIIIESYLWLAYLKTFPERLAQLGRFLLHVTTKQEEKTLNLRPFVYIVDFQAENTVL